MHCRPRIQLVSEKYPKQAYIERERERRGETGGMSVGVEDEVLQHVATFSLLHTRSSCCVRN